MDSLTIVTGEPLTYPAESNFDFVLSQLFIVALLATFILMADGKVWPEILAGGLACLFLTLRKQLNDYFLVDFSRKEVKFSRTFWGRTTLRRICAFSEIQAVVLLPSSPRHRRGWAYGVQLLLQKRRRITLVAPMADQYTEAMQISQDLAKALDVLHHGGRPRSTLSVRWNRENPSVEYVQYPGPMLKAIGIALGSLSMFPLWVMMWDGEPVAWFLAGVGGVLLLLLWLRRKVAGS